jgi:hypothetical protein
VPVARRYQPGAALGPLYDARFREFVGFYRRNRKAFAG